jgi:hypothetical protein
MDIFSHKIRDHVSHPRITDGKITALGPKSKRFMKKSERQQFYNVVITDIPDSTSPAFRMEYL